MSHPSTVDPRSRVVEGTDGRFRIAGLRCPACGEVAAFDWPRCPACRSGVEPASFGPDGTVWSSTVVRVPVPGRTPPYALAYVDLDDGPRVLAHVTGPGVPIGGRVRLTAPSPDGDVTVEALT